LKSENEFSMVKFSNYCFKPERKVNMESKNECKQNQAKTQKTNLTKTKDWAPHPPTTPHRTSPRWESSVKPKDPPVDLSKLERIEFNGTTFYLLYSRAAVSPLSESEFETLSADIADRGTVLVPIVVDEHFIIIDGEHRLRGAIKAGLKAVPIQVRPGLTEDEKWQMAEDLNLHRRHLTQAQIQEIIAENREKLPQLALKLRQEGNSLRKISETLGVSHQQVQNLIEQETSVNNLTPELPEQIKGKDGKQHPAKKPFISVNTAKELQRAVSACQTAGVENLPGKHLELKRVERIARESENNRLRQQEMQDYRNGSVELLLGDFEARGHDIEDNSVHLIMTDLPYEQKALPLWEQLSQLASLKLQPGGVLISYSGCLYLPEVIDGLGKHLTYLWMAAIYHSGAKKKIYPVGLTQGWKPLLIYYKPPLNVYWPTILDIYSGGEEKSDHEWQQSASEALHYIRAFCPPNGTLLDPCMGSGTSVIAGLQSGLGLRCIGIEIDKAAFATAEQRIKEYL